MLNLSKELLSKLVLHTTAVNSILTEALLNASQTQPADAGGEVEIDVLVIDPDRITGERQQEEPEAEPMNLDALCGDWTGGKRKPALTIFKAEPGYLAAWGKKPKKGEPQDCYLIERVNGNLRFCLDFGYIYLSHDSEADTLQLWPGGEYTRVMTDKM